MNTISPFEYVTVLISIILGMGITQLISGITNVVVRWESVKTYWPHTVLVLLIFIIHIQDWWATYELNSFQYWRLTTFLFIILYPVNLYMLARILFPIRWGTATDLKKFYLENYRKIYLFMTFLPLHSIIDNHFIGGYEFEDQILQIAVLLLLIAVIVLNKKDERIHQAIAIIFLLISIGTFVVAGNTFLISAK